MARSHSSPIWCAVGSSLVLTTLLASPGPAQDAQDAQERQESPVATFEERVAVELVNVEVWVADREGRPVTGLQTADFEVLQDGVPVSISNFSEVRAGVSIVPAPEAPAGAAPPLSSSAALESHLILYFDQLRMNPNSYKTLLPDLERFLRSKAVAPERVLVLRQGRGLFIEAPFGSSLAELHAALERVSKSGAEGLTAANETTMVLDALRQAWEESENTSGMLNNPLQAGAAAVPGADSAPRSTLSEGPGSLGPDACDLFLDRAEPVIAGWSREQGQRVAITLAHLSATASYLAGLPGVKTLLYVSDGLVTRPGNALTSYVTGLCPAKHTDLVARELTEELGRSFSTLTRHANTNRVTIHAIQATGLRGSVTEGPSSRGLAGQLRKPGLGTSFETTQRSDQRAGMSVLADETGGSAIFNQGEIFPELERIAGEMGSYYSLAYSPPDRGKTVEHRIDVRIRDGSYRVRHRHGFMEKDVEQWMGERLDGVLNLGLASNPLGVRLGAGDVRPSATEGQLTMPLHVMVPVENLAFVDAPAAERTAQLELRVLARDHASGKMVEERRTFRVRQPPGATTGLVDLGLEVDLARGTHTVAIGLRDTTSGEASFVASTLDLQN